MNKPAAAEGNWSWRYKLDDLKPEYAEQLAAIAEMTDRDGALKEIEGEGAGGPTSQAHIRLEEGAVR